MSAGDRNKSGKPSDIVRHFKYLNHENTICGRFYVGYATNDIADITCLVCLKILNERG